MNLNLLNGVVHFQQPKFELIRLNHLPFLEPAILNFRDIRMSVGQPLVL